MIFSAWSLLGAAASINMLLVVVVLAFAVAGGEAELLMLAWVLLAWLVSGPPQPLRKAAAAVAAKTAIRMLTPMLVGVSSCRRSS